MLARNENRRSASERHWHIYVDFGGTIVPEDPIDPLLARFADPSWRCIEQQWLQGRLTARERLARQVDLLRATPQDLQRFLANVRIDPGFPAFVRLCRRHRMNVLALSDGLDLAIGSILRAAGLDIPFLANELVWKGGDRWSLKFPFAEPDCSARMGNCKCSHARFSPNRFNVLVGGGRTDFCLARGCDWVLAKGRLAEHCRQQGLRHDEFEDFSEATLTLSERFTERPDQGLLRRPQTCAPANNTG
jgi:HAD superfamily phosphoserine phosphatase-like hydrolase